jgi:hypothetical protein
VIIGLLMKIFAKCSKNIKAVIVLLFAFLFVIESEITSFHESKYIAVITYGYVCYRVWGHDKPEKELAYVWLVFMPFLFGSVGGSIRLDKIKG